MEGNLSTTSDSFTAAGINMQGGTVVGAVYGVDLKQIGDISGHGRLFGDVDLGTDGNVTGSGTGLSLRADVSGSDTIVSGNLHIGNSPESITLEEVVLSSSATITSGIMGTDPTQFDQLILGGTVALGDSAEIIYQTSAISHRRLGAKPLSEFEHCEPEQDPNLMNPDIGERDKR